MVVAMVGSVGGSGVVGGVGGVVGEVRAALGASWKPLVVGAAIGAAATGAGVYLWQRAARKANEQSLETSVADMAASLRSICAVLKDTRAQAQAQQSLQAGSAAAQAFRHEPEEERGFEDEDDFTEDESDFDEDREDEEEFQEATEELRADLAAAMHGEQPRQQRRSRKQRGPQRARAQKSKQPSIIEVCLRFASSLSVVFVWAGCVGEKG